MELINNDHLVSNDVFDVCDRLQERNLTSETQNTINHNNNIFPDLSEDILSTESSEPIHLEVENLSEEPLSSEIILENISEGIISKNNISDEIPDKQSAKKLKKDDSARYKPLNLPIARIKQIIKMDPDVNLAGSEAVFLIAKSTEMFIELLSKDSFAITSSSKKKTIQKKDVDIAIQNTDALIFLDGALDF